MNKMKPVWYRILLTLCVLALGIPACDITVKTPIPPVLTPTPNATAAVFPTATDVPNALVMVGTVYIREFPNGERVGSLPLGVTALGDCVGNWCKIPSGYIWRGCTDNNPNALGCKKAK